MKLALEVHWTSNLSEFPLRVAFARAVLRSSRSSRKHEVKLRQMFQNNADAATNAGEKLRQMFNKTANPATKARNFPGKCSIKTIIPLHRCKGNVEIKPKNDYFFTRV